MIFVVLSEFFATTLGQAVAALSPSIYMASIFNPLLTLIFTLFCGVSRYAARGVSVNFRSADTHPTAHRSPSPSHR